MNGRYEFMGFGITQSTNRGLAPLKKFTNQSSPSIAVVSKRSEKLTKLKMQNCKYDWLDNVFAVQQKTVGKKNLYMYLLGLYKYDMAILKWVLK